MYNFVLFPSDEKMRQATEKENLLRRQLNEIRAQIEAKKAEMRVQKLADELAAAKAELQSLKQSTPEPVAPPTGSDDRLAVP